MAGVGLVRLGKELKMLTDEPPPGICAWPVDDCITHLQAQIQGPEDTPYERGTFLLDLQIPDRYPFEPPKVRFVTPIYHPNIDSGGRICLDTLKMRPAGSWAPSMNVPTLLTTIRLLMAHPNGDDGLMPDITELFLKSPSRFADVARAHVEQNARQDVSDAPSSSSAPPPAAAAANISSSSSASSSVQPANMATRIGDNNEARETRDHSATTRRKTAAPEDAPNGKAKRRCTKNNRSEATSSGGGAAAAVEDADRPQSEGGDVEEGSDDKGEDPGNVEASSGNGGGEEEDGAASGASSDEGNWSDSDDADGED